MKGEEGDHGVAAEFSDQNQDGKRHKRCAQAAGQEAEGIADNRQPGEEQGPDAVTPVNLLRPERVPGGETQDLLDQKTGAEDADEVGGACPEIIAQSGDDYDRRRLMAAEDQQHQQPFRAERENRGRQKTDAEEGRQALRSCKQFRKVPFQRPERESGGNFISRSPPAPLRLGGGSRPVPLQWGHSSVVSRNRLTPLKERISPLPWQNVQGGCGGGGAAPSWQPTEKVDLQDMQVHAFIDLGQGLKQEVGCGLHCHWLAGGDDDPYPVVTPMIALPAIFPYQARQEGRKFRDLLTVEDTDQQASADQQGPDPRFPRSGVLQTKLQIGEDLIRATAAEGMAHEIFYCFNIPDLCHDSLSRQTRAAPMALPTSQLSGNVTVVASRSATLGRKWRAAAPMPMSGIFSENSTPRTG